MDEYLVPDRQAKESFHSSGIKSNWNKQQQMIKVTFTNYN